MEDVIHKSPRLSETSWLLKQQKMADEKIDNAMRSCGFCEIVLPEEQLNKYPATLLFWARICRVLLIFFIVFCVLGLMTGWLLEGSMTLLEEIDSKKEIAAPSVAICPQPWGSSFTSDKLTVNDAHILEIPGGKKGKAVTWSLDQCPSAGGRLAACRCVNLEQNVLHMPEGKRGQVDHLDYISLSVGGLANEGGGSPIAFGFYAEGLPPQQWTYSEVGHITEGDLRLEEVATGKTEFSDGTSIPRFSYSKTGDTAAPGGQTTFIFGYDKYLSYVLSSFASKFSFFAMMTLLITCCAAINNFGLFDILFPEKSETAELEPNICLRFICQPCCVCCRPTDEDEIAKDPLLKLTPSSKDSSV
jgi:hypothetical protein